MRKRRTTATDRRLTCGEIKGGIVASVHNEILVEVAEDQSETAAAILAMLEAFTQTLPDALTRGAVDVKIGQTWKELK